MKQLCISHLIKNLYAFGPFQLYLYEKKSKLWHNLVPRYPENSDIRDNLYFSIVLTNAKSYIQNFSSLTTKLHGVYWPSVNFNLYVKWLLKFFILCRFVHRVSTWFLESQYFRTGGKHFSYLTQLSLSLFFIYRRNSILVRLSESRAEHRAQSTELTNCSVGIAPEDCHSKDPGLQSSQCEEHIDKHLK